MSWDNDIYNEDPPDRECQRCGDAIAYDEDTYCDACLAQRFWCGACNKLRFEEAPVVNGVGRYVCVDCAPAPEPALGQPAASYHTEDLLTYATALLHAMEAQIRAEVERFRRCAESATYIETADAYDEAAASLEDLL